MKQIKCKSCGKIWYLDDGEENYLKVCPFCESAVNKKLKVLRTWEKQYTMRFLNEG